MGSVLHLAIVARSEMTEDDEAELEEADCNNHLAEETEERRKRGGDSEVNPGS